MNKEIIKVLPLQQLRATVQEPGTLIPDHLPGLEHHPVTMTTIVHDVQVPVPPHRLTNVEDGGDHMGGKPANLKCEQP